MLQADHGHDGQHDGAVNHPCLEGAECCDLGRNPDQATNETAGVFDPATIFPREEVQVGVDAPFLANGQRFHGLVGEGVNFQIHQLLDHLITRQTFDFLAHFGQSAGQLFNRLTLAFFANFGFNLENVHRVHLFD